MKALDTLLQMQSQIHRESRATHELPVSLMPWLVDRRNLEAALERVASSDGASTPGIDGVVAAQVTANTGSWLARLSDQIMTGSYQPLAPRWVEVPKNSTGTRRIGILAIRDRVVHAALKQILEPVLEPRFLSCSFGFRPGRSVASALAAATDALAADSVEAAPFCYAVHADVADCFDTMDHAILIDQLRQRVADESLLQLIQRLLRAGGTIRRRWFSAQHRGVVQGSALSPLLCNHYLHPIDQCLARFADQTQQAVKAFRYADDLLILARDARHARLALTIAKRTTRDLRQSFRAAKSAIRPLNQGVDWLGVQIRRRPNRWSTRHEFGYIVQDAKVLGMLQRITEMTTPPSSRIDAAAFDLGRWVVSINDQMRQWRQAYLFADNGPEVFRAIDEHAGECVAELLHSVTGKRRTDLLRTYRVRLPRGFATWQVDGVRLVTLSSLAPHYPSRLVRKPAWMRPAGRIRLEPNQTDRSDLADAAFQL